MRRAGVAATAPPSRRTWPLRPVLGLALAASARLPAGTRACAYGLSLGSGVLLEDAPNLRPVPDDAAWAPVLAFARCN